MILVGSGAWGKSACVGPRCKEAGGGGVGGGGQLDVKLAVTQSHQY